MPITVTTPVEETFLAAKGIAVTGFAKNASEGPAAAAFKPVDQAATPCTTL